MKQMRALLLAVAFSLLMAGPAMAYTGIVGVVKDSLYDSGWTHGGDVWVIDRTTGAILATCELDASGNIVGTVGGNCDYGSDSLFPVADPPVNQPADNDFIEVIVEFHCLLSGGTCGGPEGVPDPASATYYEDSDVMLQKVLDSSIYTNTGPNAVQLSGMGGVSSLGFALVLGLVAGGSLLLKKSGKPSDEVVYTPPLVLHEGELEVTAGSKLDDFDNVFEKFD